MKNLVFILMALISMASCNNTGVVKGNGNIFYCEPHYLNGEEYFIQHSTLNCPSIKFGVKRGSVITYPSGRNLYCPKCMDDTLIYKFEKDFLKDE